MPQRLEIFFYYCKFGWGCLTKEFTKISQQSCSFDSGIGKDTGLSVYLCSAFLQTGLHYSSLMLIIFLKLNIDISGDSTWKLVLFLGAPKTWCFISVAWENTGRTLKHPWTANSHTNMPDYIRAAFISAWETVGLSFIFLCSFLSLLLLSPLPLFISLSASKPPRA